MRILAVILTTLALGACVAAPASRDGGLATYDAVAAATADCTAKGGKLKLKSGGNSKFLEDYACERN